MAEALAEARAEVGGEAEHVKGTWLAVLCGDQLCAAAAVDVASVHAVVNVFLLRFAKPC